MESRIATSGDVSSSLDCLLAVGRLADDLPAVARFENVAQPVAHNLVVIRQQDANHNRPLVSRNLNGLRIGRVARIAGPTAAFRVENNVVLASLAAD
jgi:hypothetical protein